MPILGFLPHPLYTSASTKYTRLGSFTMTGKDWQLIEGMRWWWSGREKHCICYSTPLLSFPPSQIHGMQILHAHPWLSPHTINRREHQVHKTGFSSKASGGGGVREREHNSICYSTPLLFFPPSQIHGMPILHMPIFGLPTHYTQTRAPSTRGKARSQSLARTGISSKASGGGGVRARRTSYAATMWRPSTAGARSPLRAHA